MYYNPFFSLIDFLLYKNSDFTFSNNTSPIKKNTLDGKPYYLIPIFKNVNSKSDLYLFGNYSLQEAHISIYKKANSNKSVLSEYHITATFFNQSTNERYHLRAYYNHCDKIAGEPIWKLFIDRNKQIIKRKPEEFRNMLRTIQQMTMPLIKDLQTIIQNKKKDLNKLHLSYTQLSQKCSTISHSINNAKKAKSVIEIIDSIISDLKELQILEPKKYREIQLKHFIQWNKKIKMTWIDTETETADEDEDSPVFDDEICYSSLKKYTPGKGKDNWQILLEQYKQLKTNKTDKKESLSETAAIQLINKIDMRLMAIQLSSNQHLSEKKQAKLKEIEEMMLEKGKNMLARALLFNKVEQIDNLYRFYHLIDNKLLNIALTNTNIDLLKHLCKLIPINHTSVTIKGKTYTTALSYCYDACKQESVKENPNKEKINKLVDCFATLVEAGADLMQPPAENMLPLAHYIINDYRLPFKERVLLTQTEKTIDKKEFLQNLITDINIYLLRKPLEPQEEQNLLNSIERYKLMLSRAKLSNNLHTNKTKEKRNQFLKTVAKLDSNAMINGFLNDPDINQLRKKLYDIEYQILKIAKPPETEVKSSLERKQKIMDFLVKSRYMFENSKFKFEAIKKDLIQFYKLQIKLAQTNLESVKDFKTYRQKIAQLQKLIIQRANLDTLSSHQRKKNALLKRLQKKVKEKSLTESNSNNKNTSETSETRINRLKEEILKLQNRIQVNIQLSKNLHKQYQEQIDLEHYDGEDAETIKPLLNEIRKIESDNHDCGDSESPPRAGTYSFNI